MRAPRSAPARSTQQARRASSPYGHPSPFLLRTAYRVTASSAKPCRSAATDGRLLSGDNRIDQGPTMADGDPDFVARREELVLRGANARGATGRDHVAGP